MAEIKTLHDEAQAAFAQAEQLYAQAVAAEDLSERRELLEQMKRARQDGVDKDELAKGLQSELDTIKRLKGEMNKPVNHLPATTQEMEKYDPNDTGAKTNADYKPPSWVQQIDGRPVPAAVQPKWVREQMGDNLKDQAEHYKQTWLQWFRAKTGDSFLQTADSRQLQAMEEGTDAEGGFFVPEDYRDIVIHDPGTPSGVFRPNCTVIQTGMKDGYLPTFGSVAWATIEEEAAYGDNTPVVGQVSFSIDKSGGKVNISRELLADAMTDIPALIQQVFNEAKGRWEDQQIIEGDGNNEPQGLRSTSITASESAASATIALADIGTWYGALPAQFRQNAKWSMKSQTAIHIYNLDNTKDSFSLSQAPDEMLYGKELLLFDGTGWDDTGSNKVVGVIGDFRNYFLIDRVGMSLRRNDYLLDNTDQVVFYARTRGDGRIGLANAFRRLSVKT